MPEGLTVQSLILLLVREFPLTSKLMFRATTQEGKPAAIPLGGVSASAGGLLFLEPLQAAAEDSSRGAAIHGKDAADVFEQLNVRLKDVISALPEEERLTLKRASSLYPTLLAQHEVGSKEP